MVQFSISYYFQSEKFLRSINLVYETYPRKGGEGAENEYAD